MNISQPLSTTLHDFAPEFGGAQAIAIVACMVAAFGIWRPRDKVGPILALTCLAAALPRLPNVGGPLLALAVAAGLGLTAGRRRFPFIHALLWLSAAVLAPNPVQTASLPSGAAAFIALLLAVLAVARGVGVSGAAQPLLAGMLALIPLQNPGLVLRSGPIPLSLEHPLAAARWGAAAKGQLAWLEAPAWAAHLPHALTAALVLAVMLAWVGQIREEDPKLQGLNRMSLGFFAIAIALLLAQIPLALAAQHVRIPGLSAAQPLATAGFSLDWSPLALGLARIFAVAGLAQTQQGRLPDWLQVHGAQATYFAAFVLFGLWALTAPAWLGSGWLSDPAVFGLFAMVAANAALPADLGQHAFLRAAAMSALWLSTLALLGGADVGAAVASQLLKMP